MAMSEGGGNLYENYKADADVESRYEDCRVDVAKKEEGRSFSRKKCLATAVALVFFALSCIAFAALFAESFLRDQQIRNEYDAVLGNLTEEKARLAEKLQKYEERNGQLQHQNEASRNLTEHLTDRLQKTQERVQELQNEIKNCMPMPGLMNCNGRPLRSILEASAEGKVPLIQRYASMDGNWTVFQRRENGSVDFARNWTEYIKGFGTPCGEYWLGLETIYQLTKNEDQELRIDMIEKGTGIHYWAEYSTFRIAPASDNYRLTAGNFSGNATNALTPTATDLGWGSANGVQFSTIDADHDSHKTKHCASQSGGGWWQRECSITRLNGRYDGVGYGGVAWRNVETNLTMNVKFVEMKIRKKYH